MSAIDKVIINIYKCVIKYQVKYDKYEQVEFTDWHEDEQMFSSAVYSLHEYKWWRN